MVVQVKHYGFGLHLLQRCSQEEAQAVEKREGPGV